MGADRVDRRVRRTRELLRGALLSLIVEKGYERVTVQDVIDRADVGRSTFYAHFRDKQELLLSGFEELREELRHAFEDAGGETGGSRAAVSWPSLAVIEHVGAYRGVSSMLGARGSVVAMRRLHQVISELLTDHLRARAPADGTRVSLEVTVEFAVGSLLELIGWWLDHDRPFSPEQMDEMYRRLTEPGIRAALRPLRVGADR